MINSIDENKVKLPAQAILDDRNSVEVVLMKRSAMLTMFLIVLIMVGGTAEGQPMFSFEFGSFGTGTGQFKSPLDAATDSLDRIIIADRNNHRVQVFDSTGVFQFAFGSSGTGPGQFNSPAGVATDSADNIIVADTFNHRIQVFDSTGGFQFQFGSFGTGSGQLRNPFGVTIDSFDNIVVADSTNARIQVFDSAGVFQFLFNCICLNSFGVATDSSGNFIVVDSDNHRIQVYDSAGVFQFQFGSFGTGPGQFSRPRGVATDSLDNIIVPDTFNHRIQVFNSAGVFQFEFGSVGSGPGQFMFPFGVTTDSSGRFIVPDDLNHRIQVFVDDSDADGVPDNLDVCAGTVIPEGVPTSRLGVNRFALVDSDGIFDSTLPGGGGNGPGLSFTIDDTAGCSCEQIIAAQGLGQGHVKFGCSIVAMEEWVELVNP